MKRNEAGSPPHTTHEAKMDSKEITDLSVRAKVTELFRKAQAGRGAWCTNRKQRDKRKKKQIIGFIEN